MERLWRQGIRCKLRVPMALFVALLMGCGGQPKDDPAPAATATLYNISGSLAQSIHSDITIRINGGVTAVISAGQQNFSFENILGSGSSYIVDISSAPTSPALSCTVDNAVGTVGSTNISNIVINCPTLISINVDSSLSLYPKSSSEKFSATGLFSDAIIRDMSSYVVWSSGDSVLATVNPEGLVQTLEAGAVSISATFGAVSANKSITVSSANLSSLQVSSLSSQTTVGGSLQLWATGFYSDSSTSNISASTSWTSANTAIATINATTGIITGISAGVVVITGTSGSVSGTYSVTINNLTITSIAVTPAIATGAVGSQLQFYATATYSDASSGDVTPYAVWSSAENSVATIKSVNDVNPGKSNLLSAGASIISATYGGQSGSVSLNVSNGVLTSISIQEASSSLPVGQAVILSVIASYDDGSTSDISGDVTWSTSSGAVATISNGVSTKGKLSGVSAGSVDITATYSGMSDVKSVSVTTATLSSLKIVPEALLISKGIDVPVSVLAVYSDATEYDVTEQAVWSSSDLTRATVSNAVGSKGFIDSKYSGSSTVSLTITSNYGGQSKNMNMIITPASLVSIELSPTNISMNRLKSQSLKAYGIFSDGASTDMTTFVEWTSSDSTIVFVSNSIVDKGTISSLAEGVASISASIGGVSQSMNVTVSDSAPETQTSIGTGLLGKYYSGIAYDTLAGERIDAAVNFAWNSGQAPLGVGDYFSVRWTGKVQAQYNETYTFTTRSDDGVRLWVNGVLVINNWTLHAPTYNTGTITLQAGQKYDIQIDFFENSGQAVIELYWQSPSQAYQIVPKQYLFHQ